MNQDVSTICHFHLTGEHLALLRSLRVIWGSSGYGAPMGDGFCPYGSTNLYQDISTIVTGPAYAPDEVGTFSDAQRVKMEQLHREVLLALQIVLQTGKIRPGWYQRETPASLWKQALSELTPTEQQFVEAFRQVCANFLQEYQAQEKPGDLTQILFPVEQFVWDRLHEMPDHFSPQVQALGWFPATTRGLRQHLDAHVTQLAVAQREWFQG